MKKLDDERQDNPAEGHHTGDLIENSLPGDRVRSKREVGRILGLSPATIDRLRAAGGFPPHTILSTRRIGWLESDIREWAGRRRQDGMLFQRRKTPAPPSGPSST